MPFHCVRLLRVVGLVVAQDLFVKENKFLAQHGLTLQAVRPNETRLTAQVGHDWWVFQITLSSNPTLCLDLAGEGVDDGTPAQLWECNGHESQLWFFDDGSFTIAWAGDSSKCLDAGDQQEGTVVQLWDCNGQDQQLWSYDGGAIFLANSASDATKCLDVQGGALSAGSPVEIWGCNSFDGQTFAMQAGITIRASGTADAYKMCLDLPGGDSTNGVTLWLWECNGSGNQYWIFDEDDNNAIKLSWDLSKCIDAGETQEGSPLMIWDCNGHGSQAFGYDVDQATLYSSWSAQSDATLCVDLNGGSLWNGGMVDLWTCNSCWNQQFQAWGPSSALSSTQSLVTLGDDCPDVPGAPSPTPPAPSGVYMPDCSLAAPGWPVFNSPSDLSADAEWSKYFQTVYGEIPSVGYPICVGAFTQIPVRGGQTSHSVQQCHDQQLGSSNNGALVDLMSPCCDPPKGTVTFIYNEQNTRHAVPENTWFEGQHVTKAGDRGAAWYYQVFGSAIWIYTGTTKVFKDHPDATTYFLGSSCNDKNHHSKPATECENDMTNWFKKAKQQSLNSIQFTDHYDCGCGEQGVSSWDKHNRLCQTEIIDIDGDGSKGCASGFYMAGWAAQQSCDCDTSKAYANCKGFGL